MSARDQQQQVGKVELAAERAVSAWRFQVVDGDEGEVARGRWSCRSSPTTRPPISPGRRRRDHLELAEAEAGLRSALAISGSSLSTCARAAISGTTPPYGACSVSHRARYKRYRRGKAKPSQGKQKHKGKRKGKGTPKRAAASSAAGLGAGPSAQVTIAAAGEGSAPAATAPPTASAPTTQGLLPGSAGFDATAYADGGKAATQAGSHPYSLELSVALNQGGGQEELRGLRLDLPPGFLLNAAATPLLCSSTDFAANSCPDHSQLGTVEVTKAGSGTRRVGLFELTTPPGSALELGAAPFGEPLRFDTQIRADRPGTYFSLATEAPQALAASSLKLVLWGIPWDASHNTERGDCLNEAEPTFALVQALGRRAALQQTARLPHLAHRVRGPALLHRSGRLLAERRHRERQRAEPRRRRRPRADRGLRDPRLRIPHARSQSALSVKKASSSSGFVSSASTTMTQASSIPRLAPAGAGAQRSGRAAHRA